ncbi:putative acetyl-CoA acetyltransferase [Mycobacterium gallinarum]|uniref:Probable acetyl-CoA acetyltransferase n=1 Tax=Mycobacterium gallinarum TaxID=39689 RepID=A0A9W4BF15_9MYCO|nr:MULTISPECIES: acetyl-CoA C-acetyltransferase [Mycobacterium]MDV3130421.1 acetyl-CoA C-acetyltransferase [Mycobacterium sp. 29Ha]BBY93032.1 putative acetyl-CoA acetyltransferase [Mycobacterium gallinarum]
MTTSVIVAGARTPIGKLMGSLKDFSGSDLGAVAIAGALEKANIPASAVDYVIMGQVLTAGAGQMPARQAAVAAGIGWDVPSLTINKMCLSGIDAIALADQLIRAGEFEVVVAGGQESMTKAPHLLMDSRAGYKYGDVTVLDHLAYDGLHDVFTDQPMGALTEQRNDADQFTRAEQDEFAARSHQKAAAAWKDGVFADEVVPVNIPQRKGDPIEFTEDEGIRANTTAESLAGLKPAFRKDGTITAGSASQISDGAAAVVVMSKEKAQEMGLTWLCEIGAHGVVAGPDSTLQSQPANAIKKAIAREGISVDQLDVIEINEAFSAVALASMKELGVDPEKVNVNGGAIAVGHPIGMSGARITLHAALELSRRRGERSDGKKQGSGYAVAALCGAGGQGDALVLRAG